jgi:hypothetical protein
MAEVGLKARPRRCICAAMVASGTPCETKPSICAKFSLGSAVCWPVIFGVQSMIATAKKTIERAAQNALASLLAKENHVFMKYPPVFQPMAITVYSFSGKQAQLALALGLNGLSAKT